MNKKLVGGIIAVIAIVGLIAAVVVAQRDSNGTDTNSNSNSESDNITGGQHANVPSNSNSDDGNTDSQTVTTDEVEIEGFAFSPTSIKIKKGTTVTWTNKDSVEHTVTGVDGADMDSGLFGKGETFSYTFNEVGTFGYICEPHPSMKGEVTVTE